LSEYRVFETDPFADDIEAITRSGQRRVLEKLRQVVDTRLDATSLERGANIRKLRNYAPPTWRYRIGSWRFFYEIDEDEKIVFMTAASHRGSAY